MERGSPHSLPLMESGKVDPKAILITDTQCLVPVAFLKHLESSFKLAHNLEALKPPKETPLRPGSNP